MLGFKNFLLDEDGAGVVEMILIIVVNCSRKKGSVQSISS